MCVTLYCARMNKHRRPVFEVVPVAAYASHLARDTHQPIHLYIYCAQQVIYHSPNAPTSADWWCGGTEKSKQAGIISLHIPNTQRMNPHVYINSYVFLMHKSGAAVLCAPKNFQGCNNMCSFLDMKAAAPFHLTFQFTLCSHLYYVLIIILLAIIASVRIASHHQQHTCKWSWLQIIYKYVQELIVWESF